MTTLDLPLSYLKSYPFPAVVFSVAKDANHTHSALGLHSRHEKIWCNEKWEGLNGLDGSVFENWVSSDDQAITFEIKDATLHFVKTINTTYVIITSVQFDHERDSDKDTTQSTSQSPPPPLQNGAVDLTPNGSSPTPSPVLSCKVLLETTDWSKTALGPREEWSPGIETMIGVVMASPTQDSLLLGPDFQMIYNQNYSKIVKHPLLFGCSANSEEAWRPVWDSVVHLIDQCLTKGEACFLVDDLLLYHRGPGGHFVEKYHTWSFVPVFDSDGSPLGLYNPTRETTADVLARRRQETTRDLSEQLLIARSAAEYYEGIAEVLERNPKDVPFIMCYSVDEEHDGLSLTLESSVGIPEDHPSAPSHLDINLPPERIRANLGSKADRLSSPTLSAISALSGPGRVLYSDAKRSWPIAKALSTRQCVVLDDCTELIQGLPLRQWEHLPESAIIIPISSETSTEVPRAVLIMGLNLLCPLDEAYEEWIHVMRAHLTSSLGSVRAYEAEHQRQVDRDRMERAKTAWFQGAAHDLRSPLTLVAGPLDDVLRTKLAPDQRQALSLAQRNLSRVQRLVNSLLDFSRIEAGKLTGHFVPIDLGTFVNNLAGLFRPAVERRRIAYNVEIDSHEGMVFVDPTLLETVVTNLLSNALKYTQSGSILVRLSFSTHANIAITDSGIGVPAAELSAVTDRFHRASTALRSGTEGTGIGLALAKEILRLHGGDLLIQSQTAEESGGPHGSTFTAQIPLVERQTVEDGLIRTAFGAYSKEVVNEAMHWIGTDLVGEPEGSVITEDSVETSNRGDAFLFDRTDVLLLVDDNDDMRHYVKQIFSPYCRVIEAADGKQALEIARKNPPHLILSDLMMPTMTGQQLLEAIREHPTTKRVPMMLLSAATDDEVRLSALTAGAEDFMTKPFKPKELLARVHLHMQMGKKRANLESLYAQREQEIALISDYCPMGIFRADASGLLVYANAAWKQFSGNDGDPNEWQGFVDSATRDRLTLLWDEVVHGDQRETAFTWRWLNGRLVSAMFIRLDKVNSGMSGVVGCVSDITYQEEKLLEAERRRVEAEEAKHQQELLVDLTSHEIRTPVSAILQCSSLVKENLEAVRTSLRTGPLVPTPALLAELDEDVEALESIQQCGLVQERIANDVLSLARIQLDMLTLHDVEMDLKKEAKKIVSVFSSEAKMKKIELVLEFGDGVKQSGVTSLKTDPVRLGQVITNLFSNAIRFTASSEIRRITARFDVAFIPPADDTCAPPDSSVYPPVVEDLPVWLFVSVKDTGPGLGPKEQAALFQRFSQGNKMIHTKYGGSGLGLFICKRISELLGGRIEMKSKLGEGSEFRFFIQCRTIKPVEPTQPITSSIAKIKLNSLHLLIVEDNIINQTVLKRQLVKEGMTCDVANDGQEALTLLHAAQQNSKQYDTILMDLEMPVMDGLTAIRHIRAGQEDGTFSRQLVIALTGNARQGQIDQALAAGMDDVVIKPYKLHDLIDKIRRAVESKNTL